jgi:regulator of sirC expression with transglutaminase-like and TPR domain
MDRRTAARQDLEMYLNLLPQARDATAIRQLLDRL